MSRIEILHWNVNGIRAISEKAVSDGQSFEAYLTERGPQILVFTETKISKGARAVNGKVGALFQSYPHRYHSHATKPGYSGVSVYSKLAPIREVPIDNDEGRLVVLEYSQFTLIATYVPNSGSKLNRLEYRTRDWDVSFRELCQKLRRHKPLVIAGDLNVAHMNKDIAHPEKHHRSAGFTDDERGNFDRLLRECDLRDTWRLLHEDQIRYTYFDYRTRARARNVGWRIDYVLISGALEGRLLASDILGDVTGSDHVPVTCTLEL